jgi:hypothetical protein
VAAEAVLDQDRPDVFVERERLCGPSHVDKADAEDDGDRDTMHERAEHETSWLLTGRLGLGAKETFNEHSKGVGVALRRH